MISHEKVRELLEYDPDTGQLFWRKNHGRAKAGVLAGDRTRSGYIRLSFGGRKHYAQRVIWLWVHGEWPPNDIDHINGIKSDNRLHNLRCATRSQNVANTDTRSTNTSGRKGVSWNRATGKWQAEIRIAGDRKYLGVFDDIEDAAAAYNEAAVERFGDFARSVP